MRKLALASLQLPQIYSLFMDFPRSCSTSWVDIKAKQVVRLRTILLPINE